MKTTTKRKAPLRRENAQFFKRSKTNPSLMSRYSLPSTKGPEKKAVDLPVTELSQLLIPPTASGFVEPLNLIATGVAGWNRNGRLIRLHSVECRYTIELKAANLGVSYPPETIRVGVFYDNSCRGTQPVWSDFFTSIDNTGAQQTSVWSPRNIANTNRFYCFHDRLFRINPVSTNTGTPVTYLNAAPTTGFSGETAEGGAHFYRKIDSLTQSFFTQGTATVSAVESGMIWVCCASSNTNSPYVFNFTSRVRFTDQ